MPIFLLSLLILGGSLGFIAWRAFNINVSGGTAVAAGMFGALLGGIGGRLGMGPWGGLLVAVIGALLIIWLSHVTQPRR